MTLTDSNRWVFSAAAAGSALIIFNPITFWVTESTIGMNRKYLADKVDNPDEPYVARPKFWGYLVHGIVFFFIIYAIISIDWTCE